MHKLLVLAAKVVTRYTAMALVLSMFASGAIAQTSRSPYGGISLDAMGLMQQLQQLQPIQGRGVGPRRPLISDVDAARENRRSAVRNFEEYEPQEDGVYGAPFTRSSIEIDYSNRSDEELTQFGYDLFYGEINDAPLVGAVQNSYILGIGDDLVITFRGQESGSYTVPIDREGRIVLPNLAPIPAAGRQIGAFRTDLKHLVQQSFLGTEVFVSVGNIRAVRVLVVGEVRYPGYKQVTSLSTALDALSLAGGISKTGSLRQVQLVRQGKSLPIDLYDLLLRGHVEHDLTLSEGDRIVVPPIGGTVGVAGWVKRPGIFELPVISDGLGLEKMVALAGGYIRPYGLRHLHLTPDASGRQNVVELDKLSGHRAKDGDILLVNLGENAQVGDVLIDGHVRVQERRSLLQAPTIRDLLRDGSTIKPDPYLLFAAVETTDQRTQARQYFPVSVGRILDGVENFALRNGDRLIIFSATDVSFLRSAAVQSILAGRGRLRPVDLELFEYDEKLKSQAGLERQLNHSSEAYISEDVSQLRHLGGLEEEGFSQDFTRRHQSSELRLKPRRNVLGKNSLRTENLDHCRSLDVLDDIVQVSPSSRFSNAISIIEFSDGERRNTRAVVCPEIFDKNPNLLVFALDHVVSLTGEIRQPGAYPIIPGTSAVSLLAVSGGATRMANMANVEITRMVINSAAGTSNLERSTVNLGDGSAAATFLDPGDVVRFNQVFSDIEDGVVIVAGEFVRPGKYRIRRGETLSELTARAGGLTPQAYPYGTIFTRKSAKLAEKQALERSVRELEAAIVTATTEDNGNAESTGLSQLISTIQDTDPVGRIVVEADPTVLQVRPELDILMQPGDVLLVPKRPNSVTVSGEVLNPGSMQFRAGLGPEDYLKFAGGTRPDADESRTFMVLPNGEAQPLNVGFWNYEPALVPPGTSIIVPRDARPFDFFSFAKDITTILSQVSIVGASLAVISDD